MTVIRGRNAKVQVSPDGGKTWITIRPLWLPSLDPCPCGGLDGSGLDVGITYNLNRRGMYIAECDHCTRRTVPCIDERGAETHWNKYASRQAVAALRL